MTLRKQARGRGRNSFSFLGSQPSASSSVARRYVALSFSSSGYGAACAVAFFFVLSSVATGYSRFDRKPPLTPGGIGGYIVRKDQKGYPLYIFTMLFAIVYSRIPRLVNESDFQEVRSRLLLLLRNCADDTVVVSQRLFFVQWRRLVPSHG